jgi:hypothetical protein
MLGRCRWIALNILLFANFSACDMGYPTQEWGSPAYDHTSRGGLLDLTGLHAALPCISCHDSGTFLPLFDPVDGNDCVACHQADYDGEHAGSGYPTTCAACHTPTVWSNGEFNHEAISGGFVLVGTHAEKACTACHDAATFAPLFDPVDGNDCVACHQADYDGEHAGSGYPTNCAACHTPTVWIPANFDHDRDYFPIFSGKHRGKWSVSGCSTCHTNPDNFSSFTCFACHKHNQTNMDNDHSEVSGYEYSSPACLSCHPNGTA